MKILSAQQIKEADAYTIDHEPIASVDLMERAAGAFCTWFRKKLGNQRPVAIFCGKGNNGGDGLAIARLMLDHGYHVSVWKLQVGTATDDYTRNEELLQNLPDIPQYRLSAGDALPTFPPQTIIVDAIFGTGLNRGIEGWVAQLLQHLNSLPLTRVAVDIPSGVEADGFAIAEAFKAHYTCTFHAPKLAFFFAENGDFVGEWQHCDIKLHPGFLKKITTPYQLLTPKAIQLHHRSRHGHKGTYGHGLLIAGSYGKIGAAMLASKACLRAGAGLVSLYAPKCGYVPVQTALPEAMPITDPDENIITQIPEIENYQAIGIGPGIGQEPKTFDALTQLITQASKPLVIDADALNLIAQNIQWINRLPANSIITPHPKEFERLFGTSTNSMERVHLALSHAKQHNIIIVLKGAYTAIVSPQQQVWFNNTGNPGMATGGSGDVLTGIITGLLCQGYKPLEAAQYGVYLHGLSGDIAAERLGMEAMIASDIIENLGEAFKQLTA